MKLKLKLSSIRFMILAFFLPLFFANLEAGFFNTGTMHTRHLILSTKGTLDNSGKLIGTESASISCDNLSGKGLISSPQISINTNVFNYTGTIECSGKCTIVVNNSFDANMFKRQGGGEFIIIKNAPSH
ncbi:MAG: hypothetical protein ACOVOR_05645 [Rhabdochlamydiaceae bacterium]